MPDKRPRTKRTPAVDEPLEIRPTDSGDLQAFSTRLPRPVYARLKRAWAGDIHLQRVPPETTLQDWVAAFFDRHLPE